MSSQFATDFQNAVSLPSGLWSRWWFTEGDQSYDAIYRDMKASIVDAGIVRIEVAKGYIWTDSPEKMASFYYLLKSADELGLRLDLATGNPYPAEIGTNALVVDGKTYYEPSMVGYTPESCHAFALNYAIQEVPEALGTVSLTENVCCWAKKMFFLPAELLPGQKLKLQQEKGESIVGLAAICTGEDGKTILASCDLTGSPLRTADGNQIALSTQNLKDLTGYYGAGDWRLLIFYTQYQERNSVCYLNCNATRAWTRWFGTYVVDNDAYWTEVMGLQAGTVRRLFNRVVSGLWEDSLEAIPVGYTAHALSDGAGDLDIFAAFHRICGYPLPADRWAALFIHGNSLYNMGTGVGEDADFVVDPIADQQIRHDYFRVLTQLYCENHLDVYTAWAKAQPGRLDTRVQTSYLYALDQDRAFHSVTIPEYESLNSSDRPDSIRAVAGAAHAAGQNIISYEMGARSVSFQHETYSMRWYDWLWHSNVGFAHGINATVLHGIEYLYGRTAKVWPGPCMAMPFAALSEPCGVRMPYWQLMKETISPYLARSQYLLQHGTPCIDAAVYYYYNEVLNDYLDHWDDPALAAAGYCYDFLGDDSLRLASQSFDAACCTMKNGGYRALIINQYRSGNRPQCATGPSAKELHAFSGHGYMPVETARRILALAQQGFPVVIVGKAPDRAAAASDNAGGTSSDGDEAVRACFRALLELPNAACAAAEADVPAVLAELGVRPRTQFDGPDTTDLYSFHRTSDTLELYLLFNRTHTIVWKDEEQSEDLLQVHKDREIPVSVTLHGAGVPYRLDCWTGRIIPLAYSRIDESTVVISLTVQPSEAVMLAMGDLPCDSRPAAGTLLQADELKDWSLELQLYQPTEVWQAQPTVSCQYTPDGMTAIASETVSGINPAPAGQLLPWAELDFLGEHPERASGIGTYRTTFTLPGSYTAGDAPVELVLEEVRELFTVRVNGIPVPFPQGCRKGSSQNIAEALQPGINTLEIVVGSGLWNAAKYYNTQAHAVNPEITPQLSEETWVSRDGLLGRVLLCVGS